MNRWLIEINWLRINRWLIFRSSTRVLSRRKKRETKRRLRQSVSSQSAEASGETGSKKRQNRAIQRNDCNLAAGQGSKYDARCYRARYLSFVQGTNTVILTWRTSERNFLFRPRAHIPSPLFPFCVLLVLPFTRTRITLVLRSCICDSALRITLEVSLLPFATFPQSHASLFSLALRKGTKQRKVRGIFLSFFFLLFSRIDSVVGIRRKLEFTC